MTSSFVIPLNVHGGAYKSSCFTEEVDTQFNVTLGSSDRWHDVIEGAPGAVSLGVAVSSSANARSPLIKKQVAAIVWNSKRRRDSSCSPGRRFFLSEASQSRELGLNFVDQKRVESCTGETK
jgi:hypothetical protein